ncbi:T9SS type B sorting domain-containing protein [Rudanella paleaurantiibacter]|uniref:T9SS type B sorting domain-containing protein n=1 Tax=Rudanella paleaurantiibacter TaxID=2614655 RepID=A0A7J5TVQ0_9BACT|nr:gliding motility-associated C-terminal domain-containing protein [Rudanella paleaurantiibacter]KAB7727095.1 T9SS type B sorting domain-containing protein [Rudanella paleaurantiibacter]
MRLKIYVLLWCSLGLLGSSFATHQVGGHLEMRALDTSPGRYLITVTNYLENNARGNQQGGGRLGIYRKRDNFLMLIFTTSQSGPRQPLVFANERCAEQRNLNFIVATFSAEINLDPLTYSDPLGYYISYQTRNRNDGIDNIMNPVNTGYTFYLEFPPLLRNGSPFLNSSPRFPAINGEYICINDPFTFAFGGTDPDGDQLRYSLVSPLNQLGSGNNNTNNVSAGPYPDVVWAPGYDSDNAIPGKPALRVNPTTGELTVTASSQGLFVFAVKVEEYRNGQLIGEVRRDFQFLVVDCPPVSLPKALVRAQNKPATASSFTICPNTGLTLLANTDPTWFYQWQRDGLNLPGDTLPTLEARMPGSYMVVVSSKTSCVQSSKSQALTVTVVDVGTQLSSSGHLCPTTGTMSFSVPASDNQTYRWFVDGQVRAGAVQPTFTTEQPGRFQVEVTNTIYGCRVRSEERTVARSAPVQATLSSSASAICPGTSLALIAGGGVNYRWQQNGQSLSHSAAAFDAQTAGTYSLTAIDEYGCEGTSAPLAIGQVPPITVTLEPVPPSCGTVAPALRLTGKPDGGVFAGTGIAPSDPATGQFSPAAAGVGLHALTYTVRPAPWCEGVAARQNALVAPIPTIGLPDTIKTWRGNTFTVDPELTGSPNQFWWEPTAFLGNSRSAQLDIVDIQHDTTYYFRVRNEGLCEARDTVRVRVFSRIWIPDAFSPNRDGQNDVWELKGVEGFTKAELTIFNRWGEVVYWSNNGYQSPFDGTFQGQPLPEGPYVFVLKPAPGYETIRGKVVVLR